MYLDKDDANLMNLAHERSERVAADTFNGQRDLVPSTMVSNCENDL